MDRVALPLVPVAKTVGLTVGLALNACLGVATLLLERESPPAPPPPAIATQPATAPVPVELIMEKAEIPKTPNQEKQPVTLESLINPF